jgi:hypothetical protein
MYQMDFPRLRYGALERSGENDPASAYFCGDCESQQTCHDFLDPHVNGLPLMGALWKVRRNLEDALGEPGDALADALLLGWLSAFDQNRIHSLIEYQWLVLDDDDHDLRNGTPHLAPIDDAFVEQGFPGFRMPVVSVECP